MPPQHITSRQNPRVKDVARLRLTRERQRQGRFVVDGAREILRAIQAGVEVVEAFVCHELLESDDARLAADRALAAAGVAATVTPEVFEKICFGERTDGVVLVAKTPQRTLASLALPPAPLVAILEGIEKPGNLGAILRSADGAGVDAVIVADPKTDMFNPNAIRASLGTIFSLPVATATSAETVRWLAERGLPIFAAKVDATQLYTEADFSRGAAIVLGSEAAGLSGEWSTAQVTGIRLPMAGVADSLNVSATAAVLFYEARQQRGVSREE